MATHRILSVEEIPAVLHELVKQEGVMGGEPSNDDPEGDDDTIFKVHMDSEEEADPEVFEDDLHQESEEVLQLEVRTDRGDLQQPDTTSEPPACSLCAMTIALIRAVSVESYHFATK